MNFFSDSEEAVGERGPGDGRESGQEEGEGEPSDNEIDLSSSVTHEGNNTTIASGPLSHYCNTSGTDLFSERKYFN